MSDRCVTPRTNHLKPGTSVQQHLSLGVGIILGERSPSRSRSRQGYPDLLPCLGICDCEFGTAPNRFCTVARVE